MWVIHPHLRKSLFWETGWEFLRPIWQIHQGHVDEQICVRPKNEIALQLSY